MVYVFFTVLKDSYLITGAKIESKWADTGPIQGLDLMRVQLMLASAYCGPNPGWDIRLNELFLELYLKSALLLDPTGCTLNPNSGRELLDAPHCFLSNPKS